MAPVYVPGLIAPGVTVTLSIDGVLPDAGDTPIHDALAEAVKLSAAALVVMLIDCAAGAVPPATDVNCRLDGVALMESADATTMFMASEPGAASTTIVTRPLSVDGSDATIAVLFHEVTGKEVPLDDPAGIATT